MPRTPEQNQAIKDRRRGKLLEAAIKVFARLGYDDVSVDSITNQAHCSHGLFYHYFDSKEDIFRALYNEVILPLAVFNQSKDASFENFPVVFAKWVKGVENADPRTLMIVQVATYARESKTVDRAGTDIRVRFDPIRTLKMAIIESQKAGDFVDGDPEGLALVLADLFFCAVIRATKGKRRELSEETLVRVLSKR